MVRYRVLMTYGAVEVKLQALLSTLAFWVGKPCRLLGRYQIFGKKYCPHFQGSLFIPKDGGCKFLRNVGTRVQVATVCNP